MANYFRLDTSFVKETGVGGRLHSAVHTAAIPNGIFCNLGDLVTDEVRTMVAPDVAVDKFLCIVQKPEINYEERYQTDYAIGIFRNPANKPVPVVPLSKKDCVDLSADYFTGRPAIAKGDYFTIAKNLVAGTQLVYSATKPSDAIYLKVVSVKDSHLATYVHSDGTRFPAPYKMVRVEVVFA